MSQPLEQLKASMRAMWTAGDFGEIAKRISGGAEEFVQRLGIPAGARVLDVACGTGNLALPLARSGAVVTGLDIAPNLLAQARQRAQQEGLGIQFDEGDAEHLPYADASFDAVVSMFGAMFAPRPEAVTSELARVLKPGGTLAMANWDPASFSGQLFKVQARHVTPPPGIPPPVLWGEDQTVRQRLAANFKEIRTKLIPVDFNLDSKPAEVVAFFRKYFGPTVTAFARLDPAAQAALEQDMIELWTSANLSKSPETHTLIRNQYLEVRAVRA